MNLGSIFFFTLKGIADKWEVLIIFLEFLKDIATTVIKYSTLNFLHIIYLVMVTTQRLLSFVLG